MTATAIEARFRLSLERDRVVAGEEVRPLLVIEGDADRSISFEDPLDARSTSIAFTLRSPEGRAARRFTMATLAEHEGEHERAHEGEHGHEGEPPFGARDGDGVPVISLGPGEAFSEALPLSRLVPLERPGRYSLEATLRLPGGGRIAAPALSFEVVPLRAVSGAVALDLGVEGLRRVTALALHEDGPGTGGALLRAVFVESDPGHGTFRPPRILACGATAAGATDVLAPLAAHDRSAGGHDWRIWLEGAALRAAHVGTEDAPLTVALGAPPEAILRPALLAPSGEVDVFLVPRGASEVRILRLFPPPEAGEESDPPGEIDAIPLDGELLSFGATLGPAPAESPRHVALVVAKKRGLCLQRWRMVYGREVVLEDETPLPRFLAPLPSSCIAIRADEEGPVEAALLAGTEARPPRLALVRVAYSRREEGGRPALTDLGLLPASPRAASIAFSVVPGSTGRLDWLVLLEDGRVVDSLAPDRPRAPEAPLCLPIALAPLGHRGYVLALDPARGPRLLPLGGGPDDGGAGCDHGRG